MSPTLAKIAKQSRKNPATKKHLEDLGKQVERGEFKAGRGAKKLKGSKGIFYVRSGGSARMFLRYSETEEGAIEILAECDKKLEKRL
jgi:hypothetical protein